MLEFKVDLTGIHDFAKRAMFEMAQEQIIDTLGDITCAVHGKQPIITIEKIDEQDGEIDLDVEGCCEEFEQIVVKKISG